MIAFKYGSRHNRLLFFKASIKADITGQYLL